MRLSKLFTKTTREAPSDEEAKNAQLLIRGSFVFKNSAGIYSFLPLGWKVAQKIINIIREEMNAIDGQEMFMPALVEKKYMEPTGRWNLDVGFFAKGLNDKEANFVLGWSHEEVLTSIASKYVSSYKDLPFSAYQIQTKFRNESRAKSGLLRGREFMMKDLYSFHATDEDMENYYQRARGAYFNVFERCGLKSIYTLAGGGVFTDKFTHEFQVLSDVGEDTIYLCSECEYAENQEITKLKEGDACPKCGGKIIEEKSIEVGNIFKYGVKYSEKIGLLFTNETGEKHPVISGAYGIGVSRLMATIVEIHNDEKGIIWPENVAPYKVHLISLDQNEEAGKVYGDLQKKGIEVLYDDRKDKTAGEKFADADLIGCPVRIVVSKKTIEKKSVEFKLRNKKEAELVPLVEVVATVSE
ncbi:MAG TPA: aminoacyl--tRNA ligase-related protein [Candidatus Paceibacterota bacterium]